MDPVCEVKEKITSGKNDWNETLEEESSLPMDLDPNEVIEANEETLPTQKRTGMTPNKQWSQEPGTRPTVCDIVTLRNSFEQNFSSGSMIRWGTRE